MISDYEFDSRILYYRFYGGKNNVTYNEWFCKLKKDFSLIESKDFFIKENIAFLDAFSYKKIEYFLKSINNNIWSIYFVGYNIDEPIKIGRTTHDPYLYIKKIQTKSPFILKFFLLFYNSDPYFETYLHDRFSSSRKNGEWFYGKDIPEFIDTFLDFEMEDYVNNINMKHYFDINNKNTENKRKSNERLSLYKSDTLNKR